MVESGINSGLPDFLYHRNLTLLPHHITHSVGHEDTYGEVPAPSKGPRRGQGGGDHKDPCPAQSVGGFPTTLRGRGLVQDMCRLPPEACPTLSRLGMTDVPPSN